MLGKYPPPPAIFGRPSRELMGAGSPGHLERFIERQIKSERKTYWFPYVLCIIVYGLGVHRFYLRQYVWGAVIVLCAVCSILLASYGAVPSGVFSLYYVACGFEVISLWWFVRRFNKLNEENIRNEYVASIF